MHRSKFVLLFGLAACAGPVAPALVTPAPTGFAAFASGAQAVSADGVVYRVREEANEPHADLEFWSEALKKHMLDAGYVFVADEPLQAGAAQGYLLEIAAPVGQTDYGYVVGVFVRGDRVVIAEAGGEIVKLKAARPAVVEAISAIRW